MSVLKIPLWVLGLIYLLYSIKDIAFKIYVFSLIEEIYSDGGKANPQVIYEAFPHCLSVCIKHQQLFQKSPMLHLLQYIIVSLLLFA